MKKRIRYAAPTLILLIAAIMPCHAAQVEIPNTFQAGTTAVASQVNANFSTVETALNNNDSRIAALEALVAALQDRIAELEESQVMALEAYITVDEDSDSRGTLVQIDGVNLQLTNGLGSTDSVNGLGNLIIGYDETNAASSPVACSNGIDVDANTCAAGGGVWSNSHKTGSHYLVLGSENSYSQFGGMVAGYRNFAIRDFAVVTGGQNNVSTGQLSSISGGNGNTAYGSYSSVSGGRANVAYGYYSNVSGGYANSTNINAPYSNVSGGYLNHAEGEYSSVSGGTYNFAEGAYSSVSGGHDNTAEGDYSSVSGGDDNTASGSYSSVSGGYDNTASGMYGSVSGGNTNTASGSYSSVSGGNSNTASGYNSSVSGGASRSATSTSDWRAGDLSQDY